MIGALWHRAMVAIGVLPPLALRWTPGAAELFAAEMNAAVERASRTETARLLTELPGKLSAALAIYDGSPRPPRPDQSPPSPTPLHPTDGGPDAAS